MPTIEMLRPNKMMMTRLLFFASEVAAAAGLHRYVQPWEVLEKAWKRSVPFDHYYAIRSKVAENVNVPVECIGTREDTITHAVESTPEIKNVLETVESQSQQVGAARALRKLDEKVQTVVEQLTWPRPTGSIPAVPNNIVSLPPIDDIKHYITKTIQCNQGIRHEEQIVQEQNILENNNRFYKKWCNEDFGIGGRIDGFRDGDLIEFKSRKYRFMKPLPLYDIIQCHCYMYMLGLDNCILIEKLRDKTKETTVEFDQDLWEQRVLPGLQSFYEKYIQFSESISLQLQYFGTNDPKERCALYADLSSSPKASFQGINLEAGN